MAIYTINKVDSIKINQKKIYNTYDQERAIYNIQRSLIIDNKNINSPVEGKMGRSYEQTLHRIANPLKAINL